MYCCDQCGNIQTLDLEEPYRSCKVSHGEPCGGCMKLELLDIQIADAKKRLENLLLRRCELGSEINQLHDSIVDRMPVEVVAFIFELYTDDMNGYFEDSYDDKSETPPPLILGSVCRAWRQLVWSTPQLWTMLSICLDLDRAVEQSQFAADWLRRSGQLPLIIVVTTNDRSNELPAEPFKPLIDVINQFSDRWDHLELHLPSYFMCLFCGNSQGAPMLRGIAVHCKPLHHNSTSEPLRFMASMPMPRIVNVSIVSLASLQIRWDKLTELTATELSLLDTLNVIQGASNLTKCNIRRIWLEVHSHNLITHPNLQTLDIGVVGPTNAQSFFGQVALPALTCFICDFGGEDSDANALLSMFTRSKCNLHTLDLSGFRFDGETLVQICQTLPTIENVHIFPNLFTHGIVELRPFYLALSRSIDPANTITFLPSLKLLDFIVPTFPWHFIPTFFPPSILSEGENTSSLRTLKIRIFPDDNDNIPYIDQENLTQIQEIINRGISLEILSHNGDTSANFFDLIAPSLERIREGSLSGSDAS